MGKYVGNKLYDAGEIGAPGCGDLAPAGGWINDQAAMGCWVVKGPTIPIGPTWVSIMAAAEIINAAFSTDATQLPVSNFVFLQGNFNFKT